MTHTRGPWHVGKEGENETEKYLLTPDDRTLVLAEIVHQGQEWEEWEANALLIAAAPGLLETLKWIVSVTQGYTPISDRARQAIAKAERR